MGADGYNSHFSYFFWNRLPGNAKKFFPGLFLAYCFVIGLVTGGATTPGLLLSYPVVMVIGVVGITIGESFGLTRKDKRKRQEADRELA